MCKNLDYSKPQSINQSFIVEISCSYLYHSHSYYNKHSLPPYLHYSLLFLYFYHHSSHPLLFSSLLSPLSLPSSFPLSLILSRLPSLPSLSFLPSFSFPPCLPPFLRLSLFATLPPSLSPSLPVSLLFFSLPHSPSFLLFLSPFLPTPFFLHLPSLNTSIPLSLALSRSLPLSLSLSFLLSFSLALLASSLSLSIFSSFFLSFSLSPYHHPTIPLHVIYILSHYLLIIMDLFCVLLGI